MKRKHILFLSAVVFFMMAAAMASVVGGPHEDKFGVLLEGNNQYVEGGGSGWSNDNGMQWFLYNEDTTQPNSWWNQWFYDDPPARDRWKYIDYAITVDPLLPGSVQITNPMVQVNIALNWSTPDYPETGPAGPPPMPNQEDWIKRAGIFPAGVIVVPGQPVSFEGRYIIPDYNPEWVSIDVFATAWGIGPDGNEIPLKVQISGDIIHECVPEPATLALLGLGAVVAAARKRV